MLAALVIGSLYAPSASSNFIDDINYSGRLRTVYIDAHKDQGTDAGAWTASAVVTAESARLLDFLSVGASWYSVAPIDDGDTRDPKNLLIYGSKDGISKLGQAYVNGQFESDQWAASVKAGRSRIYRGLISGSNSRSIPSAWQGMDGEVSFDFQTMGSLTVGAAWVDSSLPRDTAGRRHIETVSGERIDYIVGGEVHYQSDSNLSLKYLNGFAREYVRGQKVIASQEILLGEEQKLTIQAIYFESRKNGNLWTGTGGWGENAFKNKARTYDFNVKYAFENAWVRIGFSHTKADSYLDDNNAYQTANHYYDFGKYSYGAWYTWSNAGLVEELYWDGEKALALGAGYSFQGLLTGLAVEYKFLKGTSIDVVSAETGRREKSAKEWEHDIDIRYKFNDLKGLSARLRYGFYKHSNVPRENNEHQVRAYLDYQL